MVLNHRVMSLVVIMSYCFSKCMGLVKNYVGKEYQFIHIYIYCKNGNYGINWLKFALIRVI